MMYWIGLGLVLAIAYALIRIEERVNDGEN